MNTVPTLRLIGQNTGPTYGFSSTKVFTAGAAAAGSYTAITGTGGSRLQVVGFILSTNTAGTVTLKDSTGNSYASVYLTANAVGQAVWLPPGHFLLPSGNNLVLAHSGGTTETFTGTVFYNLQPV